MIEMDSHLPYLASTHLSCVPFMFIVLLRVFLVLSALCLSPLYHEPDVCVVVADDILTTTQPSE